MTLPAIEITGLGKRYKLVHRGQGFVTLRDAISGAAARLARTLRLSSTPTRFDSHEETFWALQDVSFRVERGERVGIIGRNGAGKSTLLKILSRITEPTTGRVSVSGRVASLLEVGTGFHPDLTGRENVYMNGAILGMSRAEIRRKFDEIVAFAEVERFLDTPVKRYSSGMAVRLAFAVAAHLTPEILIVDEVLAVGDAAFQRKCLGVMKNVSTAEGRTILFVSHNMAAVQALCTKAALLVRGQLARCGAVDDVIEAYAARQESGDLANGGINGPDFELLHVRVGGRDRAPLGTLRPAVIEISYRPTKDVSDAGAHIMFEDLNGFGILGLDSKDFVERVKVSAGQQVCCAFRIDSLPLAAGTFQLRVWLRSHADHLHWEVPRTFEVSIEDTAIYGSRGLARSAHGVTAASANVEVRVPPNDLSLSKVS
jgi:lipopolysaccharide transport system ATP-binding protein